MNKAIMYVAVAAMAICIGKKAMPEKEYHSDILLKNVEALANNENGTPMFCLGSGNVCCPDTKDKVEYMIRPFNLE